MEEPRIKIGFTFTDRFGNEYSTTSNVEVFEPLGERDLDVIGELLNIFLRQIGYIRSRDCMLMEDLTEEEHDALLDYLDELRNKNTPASQVLCRATSTNEYHKAPALKFKLNGGEEND